MKKTGRNYPCPCGSGRKYKACCLAQPAPSAPANNTPEWLRLAREAAANSKFAEAEAWFRLLVLSAPDHPEFLAGLGQSLCWQRKKKAGLEALRQAAAALEPRSKQDRDPQPLLDLSGQLQHWGDYPTALRLARLAARIAPRSALAQQQVAVCASRIHQLEIALPAARRAVEMLPTEPRCHLLLAWIDQAEGRLDAARDRLREVIATCHEPEQTARAWLELGSVLDRQQEYDAAFEAFHNAAELHRQLPSHRAVDSEKIFRTLASHRAGFAAETFARWPAEVLRADGLPTPVFLFGFLRSGTTLAGKILNRHPEITVGDECPLIHELSLEAARLGGVTDDLAAAPHRLDLDGIQHLRRYYWRRVEEEYGDAALRTRFIDKNALNTIEAGWIATLFPEARIVFARRDPRDVCLSCYMQAFAPAPATVNLLSLAGIARQYAAVMEYWWSLRDRLPGGYFDLGYEDSIESFEPTYSRLCAYLGVDWRPGLEQASGAGEEEMEYIATPSFAAVRQPIFHGSIRRWVHYEKHLQSVLPRLQPWVSALIYV